MSTEPKAPDVGGPELPPGCWCDKCEEDGYRICSVCSELEPKPSPQEGAELPPCTCGASPGTGFHTCSPCESLRALGITREEWARLQGVDAELLGWKKGASAEADQADRERAKNRELRTRLTEAEAKRKIWERAAGKLAAERDAERARADRAESAYVEQAVSQREELIRWTQAQHALQKRVAELEGELHTAMFDRRRGYLCAFPTCPSCYAAVTALDIDGCCMTCGLDAFHDENGNLRPCPIWDSEPTDGEATQ